MKEEEEEEEEESLGFRVPERGDFQVTWVVRLAGDGGADK
jgi:hypothetical protein